MTVVFLAWQGPCGERGFENSGLRSDIEKNGRILVSASPRNEEKINQKIQENDPKLSKNIGFSDFSANFSIFWGIEAKANIFPFFLSLFPTRGTRLRGRTF